MTGIWNEIAVGGKTMQQVRVRVRARVRVRVRVRARVRVRVRVSVDRQALPLLARARRHLARRGGHLRRVETADVMAYHA